MKSDGTNVRRLINERTDLNGTSQYPWSNLSRDKTLFVVEEKIQSGTTGRKKSILVYGSVLSNSLQTFAQGDETQVLHVVGWTTMEEI